MNNFSIGLYGGIDENKYKRDLCDNFFGLELCMFPNISEVKLITERIGLDGFNWGCHYPLIKNDNVTRDPLFMSLDVQERLKAFSDFEKEIKLIKEFGGTYILTHFPKPALIDDTVDFTYWRFKNDKEWIHTKDYPEATFECNLYDMFQKLSLLSYKYDIQIVLENDALTSRLTTSNLLICMLQKFDRIKLCLDTGRLHLQQQVDSAFDGMAFASLFAKYAYIVHLWNTTIQGNLEGGHFPVSPKQMTEDGFADIKQYLDIIFNQNSDVKVLFEHQSQTLTDEELQSCYDWVDGIYHNTAKS